MRRRHNCRVNTRISQLREFSKGEIKGLLNSQLSFRVAYPAKNNFPIGHHINTTTVQLKLKG